MKRLKKILLIILAVIVAVIILLFAFISPVAKYVIQKNSVEWTGRKIELSSLFINIFSGSVSLGGLKVYEPDQKNLFFYCRKLQTHISLPKLFTSKYDITRFALDSPSVVIIRSGSQFNFDDIIKKFSSTDTTAKSNAPPTEWWLRNFSIKNFTVKIVSTLPKNETTLQKMNLSGSDFSYNSPDYRVKTDFVFAAGGTVNSDFRMNTTTMKYLLTLQLQKVNISFLLAHLTQFLHVKELEGTLTSSLNLYGDLEHGDQIAIHGKLMLDDFGVIDTTGEKLAGIGNVNIDIDSLNTLGGVYHFSEIAIANPFAKFALYADGFNFDRILKKPDSSASGQKPEEYTNLFQMIAGYVRSITEEYLVQSYSVDRLQITGGHVSYIDYTLEDKFQYDLDSLSVFADKVSSSQDSIRINLSTVLNTTGNFKGYADMSTANFRNMKIHYTVSGFRLSDISPYSKFYVATPFLDGDVFYESNSHILDGKLKSSNELLIEHVETGEKTGNPVYDLPVRLAVSLMRDRQGNIKLDIPIEGDLDDPNYPWGKVIWQVFSNIIKKIVTSPYHFLANAFGGNENDYKEIQFDYLQRSSNDDQKKILANIANALKQKPELKAELVQIVNRQDEKENLALFEMKKEFLGYRSKDSVTQEMNDKIINLSNKDSLFNKFLDKKLGSKVQLNSVQDKCMHIVGQEKLEAMATEIMEQRNNGVNNFLVNIQSVPQQQVLVHTADSAGAVAKNAIPRFVINYTSAVSDSTQNVSPAIK